MFCINRHRLFYETGAVNLLSFQKNISYDKSSVYYRLRIEILIIFNLILMNMLEIENEVLNIADSADQYSENLK